MSNQDKILKHVFYRKTTDIVHIQSFITILFFTGKPQVAIINSSPEGLYRNKYNLTWNVKSIQPLTEVRLLFRMMVSFEMLD